MDTGKTHPPLIIGSGIAGLLTALQLSPHPCLVVTQGNLADASDTASAHAQGGIAAAIGRGDSPDQHAQDTVRAGAGLTDRTVAARVTAAAPEMIAALIQFGVTFDSDPDGSLRLGLEGGHGRRRIIHAADHTGAEIMRALKSAVRAAPHITVWEHTRARCLHQRGGRMSAITLQLKTETITLDVDHVVLATGGLGGLFARTTNPPSARGAGIALAARAGAQIRDLELVQFHPTALDVPTQQLPLISEAVRGEGVGLIDDTGVKILDDALATRDIVARAVWRAREAGRRVYLDTPALGSGFSSRFPAITKRCRAFGIDPNTEPIPVTAAAHYAMGGVAVDARGRTTLSGLWAVGEVAHTGLHGANRLASNSLLEAAAYARWVANDIKTLRRSDPARRAWRIEIAPSPVTLTPAPTAPKLETAELREIVSDALGVTRTAAKLRNAITQLEPHAAGDDEALVALLMCRGALQRSQSIGAHMRADTDALTQTSYGRSAS